jgi:Fe-S cluster assembly ATP-binding protein
MLVTQEFTIEVEGKEILSDLTLDYGPGIHIVMGPNGIGKSTFAHALMGNPAYNSSGAVQIDGKDLLAMEVHERAQAGLFVSFQTPTPIEGLSNYQFMRQCLKEKNVPIKESLGEFKRVAKEYNLPDAWDKRHLNVQASGGEKKKNELIQLELLKPSVAILDEPDSGLDVDAINTLVKRLTNYIESDDNR